MKLDQSTTPSRFIVILALTIGGAFPSMLAAQEMRDESLHICTFPAAGFFARDVAGTPSGLEYDLLTSFATAAKLKVVFDDVPLFDQVLTDIEAGKCQIGAATITVTDERRGRMAFSTPYFPNRVLVVQKAVSGFTEPAHLKDRTVAVVRGTLSTALVDRIEGAKSVLVDDDDAAFQTLLNGTADAVACDSAVVLHYMTQYPELSIAFPMGERSFFAFALPKGSKIERALNEHLKSLARSGAFTKLLAKHFGEDNAELLAEDVAKASVVKR